MVGTSRVVEDGVAQRLKVRLCLEGGSTIGAATLVHQHQMVEELEDL